MEVKAGNKLIAEFMGMKEVGTLGYGIPKEFNCQWTNCEEEDFRFHASWDWLMPVVEKIEQDEKFAVMLYSNSWDNRGKYCFSIYRELQENGSLRNRFVEFASNSKIEAVWTGVIEFIWLFNSNKIPRTEDDFNKYAVEYQRRITELQYPND